MTAGLLLVALVAFTLALLLAPLETLGWWAGWFESERDRHDPQRGFRLGPTAEPSRKPLFVVFIDGISRADVHENLRQIERFARQLELRLPEAEIVHDLFPYAPSGVPLTRRRPLSRLWRLADRRKRATRRSLVGMLVNLRNLFYVAASADRRYAPVYFQGEAQLLIGSLLRHGYDVTAPVPVVLVGYSGGAQMALGAAPYLQRVLRVPVRVISVGGVMSAHALLGELRDIDHLVGTRDVVEKLVAMVCPRRWPLLPLTLWQRARREGRLRLHVLGPMQHLGPGGYLDDTETPHGSHFERTLDATVRLARRALADHPTTTRGVRPSAQRGVRRPA